ncbi:MAG: serine hydrolase domain-containing protein [Desulfurivibrio sp.]|nr:serine hydrolase domain-containing protein [Desulfurivibrio sp.]
MSVDYGHLSSRNRVIKSYGSTTFKKSQRSVVNEKTFYDLASLTKPLATLPLMLQLLTSGRLDLDARLDDLLALKVPADKAAIRLRDLLGHSSGFAAWLPFFRRLASHYPATEKATKTRVKREVLQQILAEPLVYQPGSRTLYSDPGYILLGFIIEDIYQQSLAKLATAKIYHPLGVAAEIFFNSLIRPRPGAYAHGEYCTWRRRWLCGEVGDENCALLGGAAGHAGLFGTIVGVTTLVEYIHDCWQQCLPSTAPPLFNRRELLTCLQPRAESGGGWLLGFDTPAPYGSAAGTLFSAASIGHLGFAGTSFWIDPQRRLSAVLLSNRVHPSRLNERIRKFRPHFHDMVIKEFGDLD